MIEGARERRAEQWYLNSRLCAMVGSLMNQVGVIGSGKTPQPVLESELMPEAFLDVFGLDRSSREKEAQQQKDEMIRRDREITDKKNARRIAEGLDPLPYKEI